MTTRGELFTAVRNWTRRTNDAELDAELPRLLRNVESRIKRDIVHSNQIIVSVVTVSGRTAGVPADCLKIRSLSLTSGNRRKLEQVTPEVLREGPYWDASGDPCWYAIDRNLIYLAPAAGANTDLDISFYAHYVAMTADDSTTALLTDHFDIYLYALLAEVMSFVQDPQVQLQFEMKYANLRRELEQQDIDYQYSGSALRRSGTNFVV